MKLRNSFPILILFIITLFIVNTTAATCTRRESVVQYYEPGTPSARKDVGLNNDPTLIGEWYSDDVCNNTGSISYGDGLIYMDDAIRALAEFFRAQYGYDPVQTGNSTEVHWQSTFNTISAYDYAFYGGHGLLNPLGIAMMWYTDANGDGNTTYFYEMYPNYRLKWIMFIACNLGSGNKQSYENYLFRSYDPENVVLHGVLASSNVIYDHIYVKIGDIVYSMNVYDNLTQYIIYYIRSGYNIWDSWRYAIRRYNNDIRTIIEHTDITYQTTNATVIYVYIHAVVAIYTIPGGYPLIETIDFHYNTEYYMGTDPLAPYENPSEYYSRIESLDELPGFEVLELSMNILRIYD